MASCCISCPVAFVSSATKSNEWNEERGRSRMMHKNIDGWKVSLDRIELIQHFTMRARHIYVGERRCWILTIVNLSNCVSMKCNSFVSQWSCASYFIAQCFNSEQYLFYKIRRSPHDKYEFTVYLVCLYDWIDSNFNILNDINWCMHRAATQI